MAKYIFIIAFVVSLVFQDHLFMAGRIVDQSMWANQAEFVQTNNPEEFNTHEAYGHPGGPVIESTILLHNLSQKSYQDSLNIFMSILDSLLIAGICTMCFVLRKNIVWTVAVLATLSFERIYEQSTPPSLLAAFLATFLCLVTLYIYERKEKDVPLWILTGWSILTGMLVATRFDIGSICAATFGLILLYRLGLKKIIAMTIGAMLSFVFFDPFMWFMPVQHVQDLFAKIIYHYADFAGKMSVLEIVNISSFAGIGAFLAALFLLLRKKLQQPFPALFIGALLAMTAVVYTILLTAAFQAERYFLPPIMIWEVLFPFYIISMMSNVQFSFLKTAQAQRNAQLGLSIGIIAVSLWIPGFLMIRDIIAAL